MTLMNIEKLFFMFTIEVIRKYLPLNSTDKTSSFYCSLLQLLSLLKLKWHWQHQEKRWGSFPSSNFIAPPPKKCFEIGMIEQQQQQHFIASFCSIEMQVCIFRVIFHSSAEMVKKHTLSHIYGCLRLTKSSSMS